MRATIDSNSRAALLSLVSEPQLNITLRQLRLDFGSQPLVLSDYDVVLAGDYVSDDYYGHIPWGDSCVTVTSGYLVRMTNKAAWGATSDYHASWTTDGENDSDWDQTDIANTSAGPVDPECYANTRIGLYPKAASDSVYVWYADTNGHICRVEWAVATQTWSSITGTAYDIGDAEAIAIHPVSETEAFVVWVQDNGMYVQFLTWSGSWSADDAWLVWRSDDIVAMDAFYSDAEELSSPTYVLLLNLAHHGAVYAVRYNKTTKILTQPTEAAGSNAEWTAQRSWATGLSTYNSRLWGVVNVAFEASDETPQARHVALISTEDGLHWRLDDFVGVHPCYGKLIYDEGDTYAFVAGNAAIYKANATYKLGTDLAGMKRTGTEVSQIGITCPGINLPTGVLMRGLNVDGDIVTDDKIEDGTEVEVEIREAGESYTTLTKTYVSKVLAQSGWGTGPFSLNSRGPISRLSGEASWQHPTGRQYDSPAPYYTDFNFEDTGMSRISAAQQSGIWMTEKDPRLGRYVLEGQKGHATIPRSLVTPWLTLVSHFWFKNSVEVGGIIFFWEDSENYWRAGLRRVPGNMVVNFVIEKVVDGEVTSLVTGAPKSYTDLYPTNDGLTKEIALYLDIRPDEVRAIFLVDHTDDDFSHGDTVTLTYDLTLEEDPAPFPHHVGYEMSEWIDMEGGLNMASERLVSGVEDDMRWISYSGAKMTGVVGNYLRLEDRWYRVRNISGSGSTWKIWTSPNLRSTPAIDTPFGIYEFEEYSKIVVKDISVTDCAPPWTVDDLATNLLEMAGVSRAMDSETVYHLGHASAAVHYDIDMRVTTASPKMVIHASQVSSYSGWLVEVGTSYCTLKKYDEGTPTTMAIYPNFFELDVIASTEMRFIHRGDMLYIYAGDHFLCAFWNIRTAGSGYSGPPDTVNATTTEFPTLIDSFIFDGGTAPTGAMARLLRGRPARMREDQDGKVRLSKFETHEDLGTWSVSVVQTADGFSPSPSLIETEGADVRQYFLEKETARINLRYRKSRNESAEGPVPTLNDAARVVRLAREKSQVYEAIMMAPDIAAETEDELTIDGNDYIIEGYNIQFKRGSGKEKLKWTSNYKFREKRDDLTIGMWHVGSDDSEWGNGIHWG